MVAHVDVDVDVNVNVLKICIPFSDRSIPKSDSRLTNYSRVIRTRAHTGIHASFLRGRAEHMQVHNTRSNHSPARP